MDNGSITRIISGSDDAATPQSTTLNVPLLYTYEAQESEVQHATS
jgi:hypothetical protein